MKGGGWAGHERASEGGREGEGQDAGRGSPLWASGQSEMEGERVGETRVRESPAGFRAEIRLIQRPPVLRRHTATARALWLCPVPSAWAGAGVKVIRW